MAIYDIPNLTTGIDTAIVDTVQEIPSFSIMLIVFIFGTVLLGGIFSQKRRIGSADVPMWMTIASIAALMVTLPLTLTSGLVQLEILSIVVVITVFSGLWLFLDRKASEV